MPRSKVTFTSPFLKSFFILCLFIGLSALVAPLAAVSHVAAASEPILVAPADEATNVTVHPTLETLIPADAGDNLTVTFYGREAAGAPVPDFTFAVIPDTQHYICDAACPQDEAEYETFESQIQWIVDHQAEWNIQYVIHLGDIVEHYSWREEWELASGIMRPLEEATSAAFPEGIPYGVAIGNKDMDTSEARGELFEEYFGVERFEGRYYYGGHYGGDNQNHYDLLTLGEMELVVVYIQYKASSEHRDWADSVLKQYADRHAIVISHDMLTDEGEFSEMGQRIYADLRDNPNLFLMWAGHISTERLRADTYNTSTIYSILSDYQNWDHGGDGWFRLATFSPANNEIQVRTYSSTREEWRTGERSQFTLPYEMGGRPFQVIKRRTDVAAGTSLSAIWPELEAGTEYEWYVEVSEGATAVTSPIASFTTTTQPNPLAAPPQTLTVSIANGSDDVEESTAGEVVTTSSDLELVDDAPGAVDQIIGLRFEDVDIPQGAVIAEAYLEFVTDEVSSAGTTLAIQAEAGDHAAAFAAGNTSDVSTRPRTETAVAWDTLPAWEQLGQVHQTPDLSPLVQAVVNRSGWQSGHALAFVITGAGKRVATAYDGNPGEAPKLHVTYFTDDPGDGRSSPINGPYKRYFPLVIR